MKNLFIYLSMKQTELAQSALQANQSAKRKEKSEVCRGVAYTYSPRRTAVLRNYNLIGHSAPDCDEHNTRERERIRFLSAE